MVVIMIRRCVRKDREQQFLEKYKSESGRGNHGFIRETLLRVNIDSALPDGLVGLFSSQDDCIVYVNVAEWETWEDFSGLCELKAGSFDPEIEVAPRQRTVLSVVQETVG